MKYPALALSILIVVLMMAFGQRPAYCEVVTQVYQDGSFQVSSGEKYVLQGLKMPHETLPMLRILLAGKNIEIRKVKPAEGATYSKAFIYFENQEIQYSDGAHSEKKVKIMLNEFLLSIGAAVVDREASFDRKSNFLEIEAEAKIKGKGVWSFETEHALF